MQRIRCPKHGRKTRHLAFSGLSVYYLTEEYNAHYPPKWLTKLESNDPELEFKSPYKTTQRFVAHLKDDKQVYDELVSNNDAKKYFIFSNREKVKEEEVTTPINNTKEYNSFWSNQSDKDIKSSHYGPALDSAEDGTLTCRYCQAEMKQKKAFTKHKAICKEKIDSKRGNIIRYCKNPCHCKTCKENGYLRTDNCKYDHISGEARETWLTFRMK